MQGSTEIAGLDWAEDRLLPMFQAPQHLNIYDIENEAADVQLSVTTLVGLINRPRPQVYLLGGGDDAFWLKEALAAIPQSRPAVSGGDLLGTLLTSYRSSVEGIIIYDPNFPDSINIATTMAGQRSGIVVSPAQAEALQKEPHQLLLIDDLRNYHWQSRLQAYTWAQQNLLSGSSHHVLAGLDPKVTGALRSFLVATNAFVYWLDSRNILPGPSVGWASERSLMQEILNALPPGIIHLGWFIDEGSGVCLASQAAKPVLASDYFYNLEVWTSVQPATPIGRAEPLEKDQRTVTPAGDGHTLPEAYVSFTISDGDNLQYIQHRMAHLWWDAARGSIPLGWTIPPALIQAAPAMAAYYMQTATPNDDFIAGPSGAAYIFPSHWPKEQLPAFFERTRTFMKSLDLHTLQVLDVDSLQSVGLSFLAWIGGGGMQFSDTDLQQTFVQALAPIGLEGITSGAAGSKGNSSTFSGTPVYQNLGLANNVNKVLSLIRRAVGENNKRPLYLNVYILAWNMTPSDLKRAAEQLGSEYEIVSPGTLMRLIAEVG